MNKFIIGIGSQRAGSTLLHKILDECSSIFMHPVKELHYYDTLYQVRDSNVLTTYSKKQLDRELDRLVEAKGFGYIDKAYKCFIRTNKILANTPVEKVDYIDLYRPCILGHDYLGEITPEYMILPEAGVAQMAKELGRDTKIMLISRNPVDRFISAFKLLKNYGNPSYDSSNFEQDLEHTLATMPAWVEQQKQLNDYEAALAKYRRHFDKVLLLSFEEMIADTDGLKKQLEAFLDMPLDNAKYQQVFSKKVNAIGETAGLSEGMLTKLNNILG